MNTKQLIWITLGVALAAALGAVFTDGLPRNFLIVVMVAGAIGLPFVANRVAKPVNPEIVLGGPGYETKHPIWIWLLHMALTLQYLVSLGVVVIAAFLRFGIFDNEVPVWLVTWMPGWMAVFLAMLGAEATWKANDHGFAKSWYTRGHGIGLSIFAGITILLGLYVSFDATPMFFSTNDLVIFSLISFLAVGTQMMFASRMPSIFDLTQAMARVLKSKSKEAESATPPIVYAGVFALMATAILVFLFWRFDLLRGIGAVGGQNTVYFIVLIPVTLTTFFAVSALQVWRETRRGLFTEKMTKKLRQDLYVYGGSAFMGLIFAGILVRILVTGELQVFGIGLSGEAPKDLIMLTILATSGPIGYYLAYQQGKLSNLEARLPDLLNDLAESRRAGLTLPSALKAATRADYGPLSKHVKKMSAQVQWGTAFSEALLQFADRVRTPLVARSTRLIVEAQKTGGNIVAVLRAASQDIRIRKVIDDERRVIMLTYVIVLYVVFFVFIAVIAALQTQFVPELVAASTSVQESGNADQFRLGNVDPTELRFVFFNAAIVQAIGNGLVAGVMTDGKITAGLKHVAIMSFMAWFVFRLLLGAF